MKHIDISRFNRLFSFFCLLGALLVLGLVRVAHAGGPLVSAEDYSLYIDWHDGIEDPRLAKFSEQVKLTKIARNLGVSAKVLRAAVKKVKPLAQTAGPDTQAAIAAALEDTLLTGRVLKVSLDATQSHVIAAIKWRCGDRRDADLEAAHAAWAVSDSGSIVKTLALWCVNSADTKLFSAKIGRAGFSRISKRSIKRFASSRYIKLFEDVKRGPHR